MLGYHSRINSKLHSTLAINRPCCSDNFEPEQLSFTLHSWHFVYAHRESNNLGAIHQRRSWTSVKRGCVCVPMWTTGKGGGSAINWTSRNDFFGISGVRIGVQHSPLLTTGVRIAIYFAFQTSLYALYGPEVQEGGGVYQTDDVGQGGCVFDGWPFKIIYFKNSSYFLQQIIQFYM